MRDLPSDRSDSSGPVALKGDPQVRAAGLQRAAIPIAGSLNEGSPFSTRPA